MTRPYDLLIFDWDGTLADSVGAIVAAMQDAIVQLELPPRTDAQIGNLIGLGFLESLDILFPDLDRDAVLAQIKRYREQNPNRRMDFGRLFDGAAEVLDSLRAAGYQLAVATGKGRDGLDQSIESAGLADYFVATRTADECPSKPEPDMIEELLWETDTAPDRALMIGDTEYDLAMAANARVDAVGLLCGAHDAQRLEHCKPLALLGHVNELVRWLQQQSADASAPDHAISA